MSAATGLSPKDPPIDFGLFWFDGYAVSIRLLHNGKLQAQRVVKEPACDGIWETIAYWLKTLVAAEGGRAWYLNKRDAAEVFQQRWAEYRLASQQAFVPQSQQPYVEAAPPASGTNLLALTSATPALECVMTYLALRDRKALAMANKSLCNPMRKQLTADVDFERAMTAARRIATLDGLKRLAADYGLGSASQDRLSLSRQVLLLGALTSRASPTMGAERSSAVRHLLELACSFPPANLRRAQLALLMRSGLHGHAEFQAALVSDKPAYAALVQALAPDEEKEGLAMLGEAFIAGAGEGTNERAARWDELLADAKPGPHTPPIVVARRLAALAECLQRMWPASDAVAIQRWNALLQRLDGMDAAAGLVLACALARSLWNSARLGAERALTLASLERWRVAAGLNDDQDVVLSLATLNAEPTASRLNKWSAIWQRIENGQLLHHAAAAARFLVRAPDEEAWRPVMAFCWRNLEAHPDRCAETLLALLPMLDREQYAFPSPGLQALKRELAAAALALVKSGGPATPMLRCWWLTKAQILAEIRAHTGWDHREQILAQWLDPGGKYILLDYWSPADLLMLQPELVELADLIRQGNQAGRRPAFVGVLTAVARMCDRSILLDDRDLNGAVDVAEGTFALVRDMLNCDAAAHAIAALAQLVNSIMLLVARGSDARLASRGEALFVRVWALPWRLAPAGRQAMLEALIALKAPPDVRGKAHYWTSKMLVAATKVVDDDLPHPASLLAQLWSAAFMRDGSLRDDGYFDDVRRRLWTKVMTLPDDSFVEAVAQIAWWFSMIPSAREEERAWRQARSAVVSRLARLPGNRYPSGRERI